MLPSIPPIRKRNKTNKIIHVKTINTAHRNAMCRRTVDVFSSIVVSNLMFSHASGSTYTNKRNRFVVMPPAPSQALPPTSWGKGGGALQIELLFCN